ncbi:MAG: RNA polymerase sigma factor [Prevotella sp.]|jgi:RNA polymerase sigma-70 factor (ECF subfamily)|nr:RNA polymerase sigma factor [Prevotella sp.]MCI1281386.1 RNA polymerase sigma factor [Prevotella sp.]
MKKEHDITLSRLAKLIETESPHLLRYASYRLGNIEYAKDALQDVYLKMHSRLSEGNSSDVKDLRSYLFRTLSNLCITKLRELQKRNLVSLEENFDRTECTAEDFESDFQRISLLLNKIPEEQAEVIRLRIYGGNSFAEIADILSIPLPTVKSRFLYGLEKIRQGMKTI